MLFHKQLAFSENYPKSVVSMVPQFECVMLRPDNESYYSAFLKDVYFFSHGRYAILQALQLVGLDENSVVLMPAYHCRSMIEPALHLDGHVIFYPMKRDLSPDVEALRSLVLESKRTIKAIIVVHYFGFPQRLGEIVAICREKKITLVEDCAHAIYDLSPEKKMGSVGDLSIASPRKFFTIEDGGLLLDNRLHKTKLKLRKSRFNNEIKFLIKFIFQLIKNVLNPKETYLIKNKNFSKCSIELINELAEQPENYDGFKYLLLNKMFREGLKVSKWHMRHANHSKISSKRRNNYMQWLDELKNVSFCKPLYTYLPGNVVPYVFPLVLSKLPKTVFHALKKRGVPILRWEDTAVTECDVSEAYRISLIQLPCHQDITSQHVTFMVNTIVDVMQEIEQH